MLAFVSHLDMLLDLVASFMLRLPDGSILRHLQNAAAVGCHPCDDGSSAHQLSVTIPACSVKKHGRELELLPRLCIHDDQQAHHCSPDMFAAAIRWHQWWSNTLIGDCSKPCVCQASVNLLWHLALRCMAEERQGESAARSRADGNMSLWTYQHHHRFICYLLLKALRYLPCRR
jgi:hypothetical protein